MYTTLVHLLMMQDARRMDAYARAIREVVRPGDRVLDVGCGAGVMSFLALEAGAQHVVAVEPSESLEVARRVAARNGIGAVTFVRANMEDVPVTLPIDVLIADLRGALPILGANFRTLESAKRHLRPDGRIVARLDRILVAPVHSPSAHASVSGWARRWGTIDFSPVAELAGNQLRQVQFESQSLLAAPAAMSPDIDYRAPLPQRLALETNFAINRSGTSHGLAAWFETELSDGVSFDTSPSSPPTIYRQAFFPFEQPIEVAVGTSFAVEIVVDLAGDEPIWRWNARADGEHANRPRQSTLRGKILSGTELAIRAADGIPSLDLRGQIERAILDLVDGRRNNIQIAEQIRARFPESFPVLADALSQVGTVVWRYRSTSG